MIKRILFFVCVIAVMVVFLGGALFFSLFDFDRGSNTFKIKASVEKKVLLKKAAVKIKNWIYREATIHNPAGDVLPDGIDDKVIKEIKDRVK